MSSNVESSQPFCVKLTTALGEQIQRLRGMCKRPIIAAPFVPARHENHIPHVRTRTALALRGVKGANVNCSHASWRFHGLYMNLFYTYRMTVLELYGESDVLIVRPRNVEDVKVLCKRTLPYKVVYRIVVLIISPM